MGLGVSWYRRPVTPLRFLPCASAASPSGFCALTGASACLDSSLLVYSWGWVGGVFAAPLGFLPCAVLFLRACCVRCFHCCRFPWGFQVTRCLSLLTRLPFPYLRVGVLLACGFSGVCGLRGQSRLPFVVRHGLGFVDSYSSRWMVRVPDVFLYLTLDPSLSLPVLATGLRWLRFILGCPPFVALLWRGLTWFFVRYWLACLRGAAVPLDYWDRSPISGPLVFFPQSPTVTLLSLLWLGLLLVLVRFHYLRLPL